MDGVFEDVFVRESTDLAGAPDVLKVQGGSERYFDSDSVLLREQGTSSSSNDNDFVHIKSEARLLDLFGRLPKLPGQKLFRRGP